jgi:hypothetical protein
MQRFQFGKTTLGWVTSVNKLSFVSAYIREEVDWKHWPSRCMSGVLESPPAVEEGSVDDGGLTKSNSWKELRMAASADVGGIKSNSSISKLPRQPSPRNAGGITHVLIGIPGYEGNEFSADVDVGDSTDVRTELTGWLAGSGDDDDSNEPVGTSEKSPKSSFASSSKTASLWVDVDDGPGSSTNWQEMSLSATPFVKPDEDSVLSWSLLWPISIFIVFGLFSSCSLRNVEKLLVSSALGSDTKEMSGGCVSGKSAAVIQEKQRRTASIVEQWLKNGATKSNSVEHQKEVHDVHHEQKGLDE